jgi:hypothetical protein
LRRRAEALVLRGAGLSYPAIARRLGCSQSAAYVYVQSSLDGVTPAPVRHHKSRPFGDAGLTWAELLRRGENPASGDRVENEPRAAETADRASGDAQPACATGVRRRRILGTLRTDVRSHTQGRVSGSWTLDLLLRELPALRRESVSRDELARQLRAWGCVQRGEAWLPPPDEGDAG